MKPTEIEFKIKLAEREAQHWRNILERKSCDDCIHWRFQGCQLANGQTPPPEVQKAGCPAWEWDEVPF